MIDTLLNKLGGLLEKRFFFASFLPAFCFLVGNLLIASFAIGTGNAWNLFAGLDASVQAFLSAAAFSIAFLIAYVLSSLRGLILNLWCGAEIEVPILSGYFKARHRARFRAYKEAQFSGQDWNVARRFLVATVEPNWVQDRQVPLDNVGRRNCATVLGLAAAVRSSSEMQSLVTDRVVGLFQDYNGEDLTVFYRSINATILERTEEAEQELRRARVGLDLNYGSYTSIMPTTLGNIVQAYNQYPYNRYRIDGNLLWPRLIQVIDKDFNEDLQDKKAFLDFSLAMASALLVTAIAALIYGPFLWVGDSWFPWPIIALSLSMASLTFYRVGITAARDFGSALRAASDLFRLKLMKFVGRPWPPDLDTERAQWEELSQLAAYGTIRNLRHVEPRQGKAN